MKYEQQDILNWLLQYFAVDKVKGKEVNFSCPFCEHPSFYFNIAKRIGFCHYDKCHRKVSLKNLIDLIGSEPEPFSGLVSLKNEVKKPELPLTLPFYVKNVIDSNDLEVLKILSFRLLNSIDVKRFNIHASSNRIYVPVYEEGKLVQFVARLIDRSLPPDQGFVKNGLRYLYSEGGSISNYFLGWDECKLWDELVLVENTFNSIWLRNQFRCTTNFGSYLSKTQIQKIVRSNIKSVVLLWDEGAHFRSEEAVKALKLSGIKAVSVKITGQPDTYPIEKLKPIIQEARDTMQVHPEVDFICVL